MQSQHIIKIQFNSVYQLEGIIIIKNNNSNKFKIGLRILIKLKLHISVLYKISQLRPFWKKKKVLCNVEVTLNMYLRNVLQTANKIFWTDQIILKM
jgi:hypothetical protein